jgi:RimJ/RimL family protein N-acetyltransferase
VPRGLSGFRPPDPPLADDLIRLEPLARRLAPDMRWVEDPDAETARFTYLPTNPEPTFLDGWLGRYEDGWEAASCAGFAVRNGDGAAVGFAAFVRLDLPGKQGEIGYVVEPRARGRGIAGRAVGLLTRWGFDALGLERIELRIDPRNAASARVAERAGYSLEGVLRNVAFKEGLRSDIGVWSRLASE